MTDKPGREHSVTWRSGWSIVSVLGVVVLLSTLVGLRWKATGVREQEFQESRRVIHEIRRELDSLRGERRTVLDSVAELRSLRSSLNAEITRLRTARSQYFSDTRQHVVVDLVDRIDHELEALEAAARRATEYQELIEWLDDGRRLAAQHNMPRVDSVAEAATMARLREREKPYLDRFRRLLVVTDSMRVGGEDVRRQIANTLAGSAALDTAFIFSDSISAIVDARVERAELATNRIIAWGNWVSASPPSWRDWSYGVTFDELANEGGIHEPESLLSRLQVFEESILEEAREAQTALTLFESMLRLPPLDRLLPEDQHSLRIRIRLFLDQRSEVIRIPLEVRVQEIDEPMGVVRAGATVLENVAVARSELMALRRAMLLVGS